MNHRFFDALSDQVRARLSAASKELKLPRGFVLTREGERGDDVYFLEAGELAVKRGSRLITMLEGPRFVGLPLALGESSRSASLEVLTDSKLIAFRGEVMRELMNEDLGFARAIANELQSDLRVAWHQQDQDRQALDDFFVSPSARLVPGPYVAQLDVKTFVLRELPTRLRAHLPPGCSPMPGADDTWLLLVSDFLDVHSESPAGQNRRFSYREVSPFIPCLGPDLVPSLFCPELYPDNYLAVLLGRELYGFPKRMGRFEVGATHASLAVGNQLALRTSWSRERACSSKELGEHLASSGGASTLAARAAGQLMGVLTNPLGKALWPDVPVLVRKQIPEASSVYERSLHIDELVCIPFGLSDVRDFAVLESPEVRFLSDAFPLRGDVIVGYRQKMSFRFGAGKVLRDYREPAPSRLQSLIRRFS